MRIVRAFPALFALFLPVVVGCQPHHTEVAPASSSSSSSTQSEADRTRELEAKKAELDRREESIKNMVGSDQEKIDAANQLQRDRDALAREAEGGH